MDNQTRYKQLLKQHGITQAYSAVLLEAVTHRPCSARTVRSWLCEPDKKSARPCPDWAVAALQKAVDYMQRIVNQRHQVASDAETTVNPAP